MKFNDISVLTVEDVSKILKIGKSKSFKLFEIKAFPSFRVGGGLESDFKDWLIKQA